MCMSPRSICFPQSMRSIGGFSWSIHPPAFSSTFQPGTAVLISKSIALRQSDEKSFEVKTERRDMFFFFFEVPPRPEQWDAYLGNAKMLRPELENIDGFVDNIRYRSLTRDGWILSLSGWRDEKAVVRWRTTMRHHIVQEKGRSEILLDYHLRVGQITQDTELPAGYTLQEQRLDETEVGEGTTITLVDATWRSQGADPISADATARFLGLDSQAEGLIKWDVFDAVLTPGDLILMMSWRDKDAARAFEAKFSSPEPRRLRHVRVIRDYGMFDRREAPQYYPDVNRTEAAE